MAYNYDIILTMNMNMKNVCKKKFIPYSSPFWEEKNSHNFSE